MNSREIRSKIGTLKDELSDLKNRKKSLSKRLESLTEGLASDWDDDDAREEVRSLKSDKDILAEVISRKQSTLEELEEKLKSVTDEEQAEADYQKLIELTKKADELESEYRGKIQALDKVLRERIASIVSVRSEWRKTAEEFMRKADNHSVGFSANSARLKGNNIQRDQLIARLENDGVDVSSAMSNTVLKSEYYAMTKNGKPMGDLVFMEAILRMSKQRNVPELIKE